MAQDRLVKGFDDKILSMYARGMTTREIQGHLRRCTEFESVFPQAVVQLCIAHLVPPSLNYVNWKERKVVAADLKETYRAATAAQPEMELNASRPGGIEVSGDRQTVEKNWRA